MGDQDDVGSDLVDRQWRRDGAREPVRLLRRIGQIRVDQDDVFSMKPAWPSQLTSTEPAAGA
jgi:hypothetical protein